MTSPGAATLKQIVRQVAGMEVVKMPEGISSDAILADAQNGTIIGATRENPAGFLQTRPGLRAMLEELAGGPISTNLRFRKPDGNHSLILGVSTPQPSNNALVKIWDEGSHTLTSVDNSVYFYLWPNADAGLPGIDFRQFQNYIFIIGAQDGKLRRMPLDGSALELATGLDTPPDRPLIAATNFPIGAALYSQWAADTISGSPSDIQNGDFSGGSLTHWTATGIVDTKQPNGSPWYVQLDDLPSYIVSDRVTNNKIANTYDTTTPSGSAIRYATKFLLSGVYFTDSGGINDAVTIRIRLWDAPTGGSLIPGGEITFTYAPGVTVSDVNFTHVFSFSDPTFPANAKGYDVTLGAGASNRPGGNGPYLRGVHVIPITETTYFTDASGAVQVATLNPAGSVVSPASQRDTIFWGQQHFSYALGDAYDLTNVARLDLPYTVGYPLNNDVRFQFNLKDSASAVGFLTPVGTVNVTDDGQAYFSVDMSGVDRSSLSAVTVIEIIWLQDATVVTSGTNSGYPLVLGAFASSGELTANSTYQAIYTELVNGADPASRQESGFSPASVAVTTSALKAALQITMPASAPYNDGTGGKPDADAYGIGVVGGSDLNGYVYREYIVPIDPETSSWPGFDAHPIIITIPTTYYFTSIDGTDADGNTISYATWYPALKRLLTQMPDSYREGQSVMLDHNPPPLNSTAITVYQTRVVLTQPGYLFISRNAVDIGAGVGAGIYYNDSPNPNAPDYVNQGNKLALGVFQNVVVGGAVINLYGWHSGCFAFLAQDLYELRGINNLDFVVSKYDGTIPAGLIARNALALTDAGLFFLDATGLLCIRNADFGAGTQVTREVGFPIALLLNPAAEFGGDALDPTAFSRSSIIAHAGRVFVNIPTAESGEDIAQTLVYNLRTGQWEGRWFLGPILGGASFTGSGEEGDLITVDGNGMVSSLSGSNYGDTLLWGDDPTPVTMTLVPRRIVDYNGYNNSLAATRTLFTVNCQDTTYTVTSTLSGYNASSPNPAVWSNSYTLTGQANSFTPPTPIYVPPIISGIKLQNQIAVTSTGPAIIERASLEYTQGQER